MESNELFIPSTITDEVASELRTAYEKLCSIISESNAKNNKAPYLHGIKLEIEMEYNPEFDEDKICECGHSYDRHFDSYEKNEAVGCKYCKCYIFKEKA